MSNLSLFIVPDSFTFPSFVYAVTPDQPDTAVLLAQVEAALQGGVRLVQYRDKISAMPEKLQRARRLKQLCQAHGALLL
ncbi:MAG: thiamine-phosphate synthase, partial [Pseudomonadota bacterium]